MNFLFKIKYTDFLTVNFIIPYFDNLSRFKEIQFTTGIYTDDNLEFGKFKLYIHETNNEPLPQDYISSLDFTFKEFLEEMDKSYVIPFFNILRFKINGVTYTPTEQEKTRITDSYRLCFKEFLLSLEENISFLENISHKEINELNTIIKNNNNFKIFHSLHDKLPAKNDKNSLVKI